MWFVVRDAWQHVYTVRWLWVNQLTCTAEIPQKISCYIHLIPLSSLDGVWVWDYFNYRVIAWLQTSSRDSGTRVVITILNASDISRLVRCSVHGYYSIHLHSCWETYCRGNRCAEIVELTHGGIEIYWQHFERTVPLFIRSIQKLRRI